MALHLISSKINGNKWLHKHTFNCIPLKHGIQCTQAVYAYILNQMSSYCSWCVYPSQGHKAYIRIEKSILLLYVYYSYTVALSLHRDETTEPAFTIGWFIVSMSN